MERFELKDYLRNFTLFFGLVNTNKLIMKSVLAYMKKKERKKERLKS